MSTTEQVGTVCERQVIQRVTVGMDRKGFIFKSDTRDKGVYLDYHLSIAESEKNYCWPRGVGVERVLIIESEAVMEDQNGNMSTGQEENAVSHAELKDQCAEIIKQYKDAIHDINEAKTKLEEITPGLSQRITAELSEFESNTRNLLTTNMDALVTQIASEKSALDDFRKEIQTEYAQICRDNTKKLSTAIAGFQDEAASVLKETMEKVAETFSNAMQGHNTKTAEALRGVNTGYEELKQKIESLLGEALAVGLANSFKNEREFHKKSAESYSKYFTLSVVAMIGIPSFLYYFGIIDLKDIKSPEVLLYTMIRIAAFEWPLVWLATSFLKKASQQQRIYEEYAHKYTAAMTYVGMRNEVKQAPISRSSEELNEFTDKFILSVFLNPSFTLDKAVDTQNPLEHITKEIRTLAEQVKEISEAIASKE